jgi:thiamine pyrophosphokinase
VKKKHFIIVANGNFLVKEIITEAIQDKIIIALDAASDKLARMGIMPDIILGDFDNEDKTHAHRWGIHTTFQDLRDEDQPYQGNHGVTLVPGKNQNLTDLTKAIHYCDANGAESITLICALGGRMDHHEAALRSLRTEYKKNRPILLHTEQQTLRFAKNEAVQLSGEIGDKCGIFAFPSGSFSSQGLVYEVENYPLQFGFSESVGNSLKATHAAVTITGEALLIMPPQLAVQRAFLQKNERERLEMLLRDL